MSFISRLRAGIDWLGVRHCKAMIWEALRTAPTSGSIRLPEAHDPLVARAVQELMQEHPSLFEVLDWSAEAITLAPVGVMGIGLDERGFLAHHGRLYGSEGAREKMDPRSRQLAADREATAKARAVQERLELEEERQAETSRKAGNAPIIVGPGD